MTAPPPPPPTVANLSLEPKPSSAFFLSHAATPADLFMVYKAEGHGNRKYFSSETLELKICSGD